MDFSCKRRRQFTLLLSPHVFFVPVVRDVQARRLEMTCGERFVPNPAAAAASTNVMDAWIQATLQGLVQVTIYIYVCDEVTARRRIVRRSSLCVIARAEYFLPV